jgi:hypothetical protein
MCMNFGCRLFLPRLHNTHIPLREGGSSSLSFFKEFVQKFGVWMFTRFSQTYVYTLVFRAMTKSVNSGIGRSSAHVQ